MRRSIPIGGKIQDIAGVELGNEGLGVLVFGKLFIVWIV